jgi:hypothetical protein
MIKVAVIELGGSHDECILSQLVALKSYNCHITLICTQDLYARNPNWKSSMDEFHPISFPGTSLGDFRKMVELNRYLKKEQIEKVIINTAQGGHVRNLCLTAPKQIEFIGIIHTLRKFQGSFTQCLISLKIKKYFVLNDYFLEKINAHDKVKVSSFYPLRFPEYPSDLKIDKPTGEIWIAIIGGVENRRKDLFGSIELMNQTDRSFRFIFLGKSDPMKNEVGEFKEKIRTSGLEDRVVLFDRFIEGELFDAYLKKCDLIWPMVHPETDSAVEYFKNQISGAMNVSFAYKIPLMVHRSFSVDWKDLSSSVHYDLGSFREDLSFGIQNIERLREELRSNQKFDPTYQEDQFLALIFS